ncbi:hypothetical protein [Microlunatus antarcticus]|uniref:Uncharacterized protein n=1 Tax=Microlunatus antarcticus TaxID=53388 RepID=A0A7W5JY28_9ACTN|nr:hypothetical protein [Microlunatus antarcticus]MBB3328395.1 hypothetical protein [Microlunatus antarcticus]
MTAVDTPRTGRTRTRVAHLVLLLAGLVVIGYALTLGGSPALRCHDAVMTPGSVCLKADGSEGQTYEQRIATRRSAQPVVAGLGVLMAGFGGALLVADLRRRPRDGRPSAVEDAG